MHILGTSLFHRTTVEQMDFTPLGVLYHFKRQFLGQSPVSANPMSIDQLNRLEFAWDKFFRDGSDTAMNL
jgi:hypothetical protein